MKKIVSFNLIFVLLLLCGCSAENIETRFLLDTAVTITADCTQEVIDSAFKKVKSYEKLLSRTVKESEISEINSSSGEVSISEDTKTVISRGLYFGALTNGRFDITICPVSSLWDFKNQIVPSKDEIASALKSVDYEGVKVFENTVYCGEKQIDLGGIGKGYIADRLLEYLKEKGAKNGKIDLGGNLIVFGDREYNIGIIKPFETEKIAASVKIRNKSIVTSGIYERSFKKNGRRYHHILDPETGYPVESDLYSATIISDSSMDGDALATCCILLGLKDGTRLIENFPDAEAIFIDNEGKITHTSGIEQYNGSYHLK